MAIIDYGNVVICSEPMEEVRRESQGIKWCFHCRTRSEFWWVKFWPTNLYSYYGGSYSMVCGNCGAEDGDLFPGWSRGYGDD